MKYHPQLKKAMQQIQNILIAEDIGAVVILHKPGFIEYLNRIDPKYSCIRIGMINHPETGEPMDGYQIKATEAEHGKEKRDQLINDSVNMIVLLNDIHKKIAFQNKAIENLLEQKYEITKGPEGHSGHTEQNN